MTNTVHGVGLVISNAAGNIMLLQELKDKPYFGKKAGMLSIPFEGIEGLESPDEAIIRLLFEEVGAPIELQPTFFKEMLVQLTEHFSVKLYVYTAKCDDSFVGRPFDTDISYFGWLTPAEILCLDPNQVRIEVAPVLTALLDL